MIDKELSLIAAYACKDVYKDNIDLGTTEYKTSVQYYKGKLIQVLAIAGTNETRDWIKNFSLWSTKGIKKVAVDAVEEIRRDFCRYPEIPLLVTGHSKAGATAVAWQKLYPADYCIGFCPARSLRYWTNRELENTKLYIDRDDIVTKVGCVSFCHPKCETEYLPDDNFGISINDHFIDHIIEYLEHR